MHWRGTAVTLVAGLVALRVVILSKPPAHDLGSVSDQWIAHLSCRSAVSVPRVIHIPVVRGAVSSTIGTNLASSLPAA
jgi:hypothetical protein